MKNILTLSLTSAALIALGACQTVPKDEQDKAFDPSKIVLGNGDKNRIETNGLSRSGPTFTVSEVEAANDSFLVLHPFKDGNPVREDYVAATFVPAGVQESVVITTEAVPEAGEMFIVMLHEDVDQDREFDFGDGVTVPDKPVFEGYTMIAARVSAPDNVPVSPTIIRASAKQNAALAQNYLERSAFRDDGPTNRMKATAYQWMAIAENPSDKADDAPALFAEEFQINFSSGPITTRDGIVDWLKGPASQFEATRHVLSDFTVATVASDRYRLGMTTDWNGLTSDGRRMTAKTSHIWYLIDQGAGEMPLIETIDVTISEPFAPADWE